MGIVGLIHCFWVRAIVPKLTRKRDLALVCPQGAAPQRVQNAHLVGRRHADGNENGRVPLDLLAVLDFRDALEPFQCPTFVLLAEQMLDADRAEVATKHTECLQRDSHHWDV
jgi:hypothetical protein